MQKKSKINIFFSIFLSFFACFWFFLQSININFVNAFENLQTSAKAMAMVEVQSGRLLFAKNQDQKLPMASTTKIATAITVIDNCENLDEEFEIDSRAVGVEGTSIYLQKGERLTARQLLYGLMLRSGNDASVALALNLCKSIEDFANLMNQTAQKVGATNTHFVNPHGLDNDEHYTTAHDLALITAYALKNKTFKEIVSTKSISIPHPEYNKRHLVNKNRLLNSLDGCIGVKTGYTKKAGRCLVSAVERDNMAVVCVVLNCGPMFEESATMLETAFAKYKNVELMPPYNYVRSINVENGEKQKCKVYCPQKFDYPLTIEERADVHIEYDLPSILQAPIKQEEKVGTVKIYFGDKLLFQNDLLTMEDVASEKITDQIKDIIKKW